MEKKSFFLSTCLLLSFLSLIHGIYNGNCTQDCSSSMGMRCESNRCLCDTPWFAPCNSSICVVEKRISYVEDECRTDENCVTNAICNATTQRCECDDDFIGTNGLCYKSLNSPCQHSDECWSRECRDNRCRCRVGYIVQDDQGRCKLNPARIHANWTSANETQDFCHDNTSCYDRMAICRDDSVHAEKFCQCPSTHTANYERGTCEWKIYNGLSPSATPLPNTDCGKCQAANAICTHVNEQTTCWCLAGFVKNDNNTCKKQQRKHIFPSSSNIQMHQYDFNCSLDRSSGLCACPSGYEFVMETATCRRIVPQWNGNQLEYSVCTRINSRGIAVPEDGLCPTPLQCEIRNDKHVCSCGKDKYLDKTYTLCYSYLNRNTTNQTCPENSQFIDSQCQCSPSDIYLPYDGNQICKLELVNQDLQNCNLSVNDHGECVRHYGEYATFCKRGECRCLPDQSFYHEKRCITFIGGNTTRNNCPNNAWNENGKCQCLPGYRPNRENKICDRLSVSLSNSTNPIPINANFGLTVADCQTLYPQQNVQYANHSCICQESSIAVNNSCIFALNYTFTPNSNINHECPQSASVVSNTCQCDLGYKQTSEYTCRKITETVYEHNQSNENITGLTDQICKRLFGNAAEKHPNYDHCQCLNANLAFRRDNKCYFLIGINQTQPVSSFECPPRSIPNDHMCTCLRYHPVNADNKGCQETRSLSFARKTLKASEGTCSALYTNDDCELLYGTGAICHQNQCYCDRSKSYVDNNKCKLLSSNIFPGKHEWHLYTCETDADCGTNGVKCDFLGDNYRVCQCQDEYYYSSIEKKCVQGFCEKCPENEKCQGYECVCEKGYYRDSSNKCVTTNKRFTLYEQCNQTYFDRVQTQNQEFECSLDCEHIRCRKEYRNDGAQCVEYKFTDQCAHDTSICARLSPGAVCDLNENKCVCTTGYYQVDNENICVKIVGSPCERHDECGEGGSCVGGQCQCAADTKIEEDVDHAGIKFQRCVKLSSVDQLRSYPIILILMLCIHLFTA